MRQTASRWVQPVKDGEKPTEIRSLPLLWVGSGPAGTHEELLYTETHTQSTIKSSAGTNAMAKFMFELQPNIGSPSVFQAWGVQNPYIHIEACSKSPPKVNFSGHREKKDITNFPTFTSSWALKSGKMCLTQPLADMALGESLGKGLFCRSPSALSHHPDIGTKYRIFFFLFNILKNK